MSTYALLVGIEKYDQPGWDVPGPCANAVAVARWLISTGIPPSNIHAFLDPMNGLVDDIALLQRAGVQVRCPADWVTIDTFSRTALPAGCPANSRLLVYWSGHGCTSRGGNRIFFCRDYVEKLPSRVFNGSNFLRSLRSPDYRCFAEQIFLADVCGVYSRSPISDLSEAPERQGDTRQLAYFATPEGKYAIGPNGRGVFTEAALNVLRQAGGWPDRHSFAQRLEEALGKVGQTPFRISGLRDDAEIPEVLVGFVGENAGNSYFQSAIELLSGMDVISDVFLPHYLRTVADLGIPELANAQGLIGIVKELSSLRDAELTKGVPRGLLQFLMRLAQEEPFEKPIREWLAKNAESQENTLRQIRKALELEADQKILIILVEIDEKREIAAYRPYLRNSDFSPVPERTFAKRTVRDWQDFELSLQGLFCEFMVDGNLSNLEIHFIVDPPLFDRAFHLIPATRDGSPIGEQVVVLLRHRRRVLSADRRLRTAWKEYADSLRPARPNALKWLQIDSGGSPLPKEKGLCFVSFILPAVYTGGAACESEKRIVARLLDLGAPYIYLPHALPHGADWQAVAKELTELLSELRTLDGFPTKFMAERLRGSVTALQASILWDDPLSNPFTTTEGVTVG
jgi:hypothetical protein